MDIDAPLTEETVSQPESIAQSELTSEDEPSADENDGLPIGGIAAGCAVLAAGAALTALLVAKKKK